MKHKKRWLSALCLLLLTTMVWPARAQESDEPDTPFITAASDKEEYQSDDVINLEASMNNRSADVLQNLEFTITIPESLQAADGESLTRQLQSVSPGEIGSVSFLLESKKKSDNPGDSSGEGTEKPGDSEKPNQPADPEDPNAPDGSGKDDPSEKPGESNGSSPPTQKNEKKENAVKTGISTGETAILTLFLISGAVLIVADRRTKGKILVFIVTGSIALGALSPLVTHAEETVPTESSSVVLEILVEGETAKITVDCTYQRAEQKERVHIVRFIPDGQYLTDSTPEFIQMVADGEYVQQPDIPEKGNRETFIGWYPESDEYSTVYTFDEPVYEDLTLYGKWYDPQTDTEDSDGDGLSNGLEKAIGTDPNNPDCDGDGLTDYTEVYWLNSNPWKQDTDGDGVKDPDEDADGDTLTNLTEQNLGTIPIFVDSDADLVSDQDELNIYGTDPTNPDSDGDGIPDGKEIEFEMNPLDSADAEEGISVEAESDPISETQMMAAKAEVQFKNVPLESQVSVSPIEYGTDPYLSRTIPGYVDGFEFTCPNQDWMNASIEFEFSPEIMENADDLMVYYYNESTHQLESLEKNTFWTDDSKLRVENLTHFSKYVVVHRQEFNNAVPPSVLPPNSISSGQHAAKDFLIMVDHSLDMRNIDKNYNYVAFLKRLTSKFLDDGMGDYRFRIGTFFQEVEYLSDFSSDADELNAAYDSIRYNEDGPSGSSWHAAMVDEILETGFDEESGRQKELIIMTSNTPETGYQSAGKASSQGVSISVISRFYSLNAQAHTFTGGHGNQYFTPNSIFTVSQSWDDILNGIYNNLRDLSQDSNGDGLLDFYAEMINNGDLVLGTKSGYLTGILDMCDPDDPDWDDDGLLNGEELQITNQNGRAVVVLKSDPLNADTDLDGYTDLEEQTLNLNPLVPDSPRLDDLNDLISNEGYLYSDFEKNDSCSDMLQLIFGFEQRDNAREAIVKLICDYSLDEDYDALSDESAYYQISKSARDNCQSQLDALKLIKDILDLGLDAGYVEPDEAEETINTVSQQIKSGKEIAKRIESNKTDLEQQISDYKQLFGISKSIGSLFEDSFETEEWQDRINLSIGKLKLSLALARLVDEEIVFSFGTRLGKLIEKTSKFLDKEIGGVKINSGISIAFSALDTSSELFDRYVMLTQIRANVGSFQRSQQIFEKAITGDPSVKPVYNKGYVRQAFSEIYTLFMEQGWENYIGPVYNMMKQPVGDLLFSIAAELDPTGFTKVMLVVYKVFHIVGGNVAKTASQVDAIQLYSDCAASLIQENVRMDLQNSSFQYKLEDKSQLDDTIRLLGNSRVYGEYCLYSMMNNKGVTEAISRWLQNLTPEVINEMYRTRKNRILNTGENLGVDLSYKLPSSV